MSNNTLPVIEIGDTVIFRTDLEPNTPYGRLSFKTGMSHILGTEKMVTKISEAKNFACGDEWWYSEEMVKEVIKPTKERVYTEQEMKEAIEMAAISREQTREVSKSIGLSLGFDLGLKHHDAYYEGLDNSDLDEEEYRRQYFESIIESLNK